MAGFVPLDVKKNRFDGFLGRLVLQFNPINQLLIQQSNVINFDVKRNENITSISAKLAKSPKELWEQSKLRSPSESDIVKESSLTTATKECIDVTTSAVMSAKEVSRAGIMEGLKSAIVSKTADGNTVAVKSRQTRATTKGKGKNINGLT
jgi:hypothetical protein